MANKRFMDFTTDIAPSGSSFLLEADSVNGVRKTTIENAVAGTNAVTQLSQKVIGVFADGAAQHNSIYRGKNLTAYFDSGDMSAAIADGSFRDIYPGDYIIKSVTIDGTTYSDVRWTVMDLDYHLHCGDTETTTHHVVIMPEESLGAVSMNSENTTEGGYLGTKMWTEYIPKVATGLVNAFGAAHILEHREYLTNNVDTNIKSSTLDNFTGASTNCEWASVKVNLVNENMVFGAPIMSSSAMDTGEWNTQLAAFALNPSLRCSKRFYWWLRSVARSTDFCFVERNGMVSYRQASAPGAVRPIALLY